MQKPVLTISELRANVEDKEILKGVNLEIKGGEVHAIMGPNGTGKSTLSSTIMGHPKYHVTSGNVTLNNEDVLAMSVDERARAGLFLAMQYPAEVPGVTNSDFLRTAMQTRMEEGKDVPLFKFIRELDKSVAKLEMREDLPHRYLNEGFSGGEKKRNEILQMRLLNPAIAMLDEIDSGLDVDALQTVSEAIRKQQELGTGFLVISHYARLYDLISPTRVAVMVNGKIAVEGGKEIIKKIDTTGYEWIRTELGISIEKDEPNMRDVSIGSCATKEVVKSGK